MAHQLTNGRSHRQHSSAGKRRTFHIVLQYEWTSNTWCWVKEVRHRRLHIPSPMKFQQEAKLQRWKMLAVTWCGVEMKTSGSRESSEWKTCPKTGLWWWIYTWINLVKDFPSGSAGKDLTHQCGRQKEMPVWSLGQEDLLEKEMATHSNTLPWKIP